MTGAWVHNTFRQRMSIFCILADTRTVTGSQRSERGDLRTGEKRQMISVKGHEFNAEPNACAMLDLRGHRASQAAFVMKLLGR